MLAACGTCFEALEHPLSPERPSIPPERERAAAEAKAAAAEAAAEKAKEAASTGVLEAERGVREAHGLLDAVRKELLDSELARAEDAARAREEIERLSARQQREAARLPVDVVASRGSNGLMDGMDVQLGGAERVRVVPARNAAGRIVKMRRRK